MLPLSEKSQGGWDGGLAQGFGGTWVMGGPRTLGWTHMVGGLLLEDLGSDAAAALPSSPRPSLGGSDPPIGPALWGSQMQTAVVSRESLRFWTPDSIIQEMPPHQIALETLITSK